MTPRRLLRSVNTALLILLYAVGQLHVPASEFPGKGIPYGVAGCAVASEDEMRDDRVGNRTPLVQLIALFAICCKHRHLEVNGDSDNWHTVFALLYVAPWTARCNRPATRGKWRRLRSS